MSNDSLTATNTDPTLSTSIQETTIVNNDQGTSSSSSSSQQQPPQPSSSNKIDYTNIDEFKHNDMDDIEEDSDILMCGIIKTGVTADEGLCFWGNYTAKFYKNYSCDLMKGTMQSFGQTTQKMKLVFKDNTITGIGGTTEIGNNARVIYTIRGQYAVYEKDPQYVAVKLYRLDLCDPYDKHDMDSQILPTIRKIGWKEKNAPRDDLRFDGKVWVLPGVSFQKSITDGLEKGIAGVNFFDRYVKKKQIENEDDDEKRPATLEEFLESHTKGRRALENITMLVKRKMKSHSGYQTVTFDENKNIDELLATIPVHITEYIRRAEEMKRVLIQREQEAEEQRKREAEEIVRVKEERKRQELIDTMKAKEEALRKKFNEENKRRMDEMRRNEEDNRRRIEVQNQRAMEQEIESMKAKENERIRQHQEEQRECELEREERLKSLRYEKSIQLKEEKRTQKRMDDRKRYLDAEILQLQQEKNLQEQQQQQQQVFANGTPSPKRQKIVQQNNSTLEALSSKVGLATSNSSVLRTPCRDYNINVNDNNNSNANNTIGIPQISNTGNNNNNNSSLTNKNTSCVGSLHALPPPSPADSLNTPMQTNNNQNQLNNNSKKVLKDSTHHVRNNENTLNGYPTNTNTTTNNNNHTKKKNRDGIVVEKRHDGIVLVEIDGVKFRRQEVVTDVLIATNKIDGIQVISKIQTVKGHALVEIQDDKRAMASAPHKYIETL